MSGAEQALRWQRADFITIGPMRAEGWYQDPYKIHTDRWFSDGTPTELVRDGRTDSKDPPPDTPFSGPLVESVSKEEADGDDLRRADDPTPEGEYDSKKSVDAAFDAFPWGPVS